MKLIGLFVILLILGILLGTGIGTADISYLEIVTLFFQAFSGQHDPSLASHAAIIFLIRLPRVLLAILVGAALGISGAVMQGLYRNPMADPSIIGISSGATLGAVVAIFFGLATTGLYYQPVLAIIGAIFVAFLVLRLAIREDQIQMMTLLLAGIAANAFISAITSLLLSFAYEYQLKQYLFWTIGGLDGATWQALHFILLPILLGIIFLCFYACELNLLLLGEEEAQSLGLHPTRVRSKLLLVASLITALAVSVSGMIGFVGLIIPHILRLLVGSDHRILLPASALGGSVFLLFSDLVARTAFPMGEVRVGIITALVGAPYFLYLLLKIRKEGVSI